MSVELSPARAGAQSSDNIDPLLDEVAAGAYLGGPGSPISERTLQRWRFDRTGPAYIKVGRLVRYRRSALDTFLTAGEQQPVEAA